MVIPSISRQFLAFSGTRGLEFTEFHPTAAPRSLPSCGRRVSRSRTKRRHTSECRTRRSLVLSCATTTARMRMIVARSMNAIERGNRRRLRSLRRKCAPCGGHERRQTRLGGIDPLCVQLGDRLLDGLHRPRRLVTPACYIATRTRRSRIIRRVRHSASRSLPRLTWVEPVDGHVGHAA